MKLGFFEEVEVLASLKHPQFIGRTGVVLGVSEDDQRIYGYSVFFEEEEEGYGFLPEVLRGTGVYVDRSVFYDPADVIRVKVKDGQGYLSEDRLDGAHNARNHG